MDLDILLNKASQMDSPIVAVTVSEDQEVLEAISLALKMNLARFILFGDSEKIKSIMKVHVPNLLENNDVTLEHTENSIAACTKAVMAVRQQRANILMKGNIATATILKEVLNKEYGLRTERVLSQVAVFKIPNQSHFILMTDAGMNIAPNLVQKEQILMNAVQIAKSIGITNPKVAALAAVEVVNPNMQATIDAAALAEKNKKGQISGCVIEGPYALDIAVSKEAAKHKGIESAVAGSADILLVPNIESGNVLYKSMVYFSNAQVGSIIAGATAPIVLTSRSDSAKSKLHSLALAICSINNHKGE